ncbi:MAG: hypothetical protein ACEY3K_13575 [Wolbachia sp.]
MVGNVTKWKHVFDAPEQKLDDQLAQYGVNPHHDCHRRCEQSSWTSITEAICKKKCDMGWYDHVFSPSQSRESTLKLELTDIANNLLDENAKLSLIVDEIQSISI